MTTDDTPRPSPERTGLQFDAPHLAFGICVVAVGLALTLDRLQILSAARILRFWPVGLILIGAGMVAQAFWPGADVYAGGRRRRITPLFFFGMLLTIAVLTGQRVDRQAVARSGSEAGDTVTLFSIMGRDNQISTASRFRGGDMTSVMGESVLDLREATIAPGEEAVIDVFTVMGGVVLRVPSEWTVEIRTVPLMGGVKDQRDQRTRDSEGQRTAAAPRVVVRGLIVMGGLTIKS